MRSNGHAAIVHGVLGGLLAGLLVAAWFLAVDLISGDPFRTPTRLGAALFDLPVADRATIVPLYTLLHLGTFAILGAATAWFLAATETAPRMLTGAVFGLGVLNGVHYVGLLVTGAELLTVLPWPHVVGANLLAGLALMTFLHRIDENPASFGLGALRDHPLLAEGLRVGMIGAGVVAGWFLLIDIAAGAPLRTPAALGSVVFLGADGASLVSSAPGIIAAYTVLHLALFWAAGIGFAAVARGIEKLPSFAYLTLMCAILLEAVTFAALVSLGQTVLGSLSVWGVGVANVLAIGSMAGWIWRTHPRMRERVLTEGLASSP